MRIVNALAEYDAAVRTLKQLGYTYHGGEQFKPPLCETGVSKSVYTQAMSDNGDLPSVGMKAKLCISEFAAIHHTDRGYNNEHCEIVAHVESFAVAIVRGEDGEICFTITANNEWFKTIDTRTDEEKCYDDLALIGITQYSLIDAIKVGEIHGVTWSKSNE